MPTDPPAPSSDSSAPRPWRSNGWERLRRAAGHQFAGLRHGLTQDPAIRQVTVVALGLAGVAVLLPVAPLERLALICSVLLVAVVEVLNSAIEACIDRVSPERHELSRIAKDYGSVAVGGTVIMATLCWGTIAGPIVWRWLAPA